MPALMPSLVPTPMLQPKPPVTNTRASLPRIHKDRVLRTPEARFAGLTDFPYTGHVFPSSALIAACSTSRPPIA